MQYNTIPAHLIGIAWIVWMAVWLVGMFSAKRNVRSSRGRWLAYRVGVAIVIYAILASSGSFRVVTMSYIHNASVQWIGVALVYLGAAVAIWARFHLGRNWGMPMSEKEGAELVTTGPYAYIRNPIYGGVFFAAIGSALALGLLWAIVLVIYAAYFIPSIFVEERIMARLFPEQYPAYKARTKRLIPWVW